MSFSASGALIIEPHLWQDLAVRSAAIEFRELFAPLPFSLKGFRAIQRQSWVIRDHNPITAKRSIRPVDGVRLALRLRVHLIGSLSTQFQAHISDPVTVAVQFYQIHSRARESAGLDGVSKLVGEVPVGKDQVMYGAGVNKMSCNRTLPNVDLKRDIAESAR